MNELKKIISVAFFSVALCVFIAGCGSSTETKKNIENPAEQVASNDEFVASAKADGFEMVEENDNQQQSQLNIINTIQQYGNESFFPTNYDGSNSETNPFKNDTLFSVSEENGIVSVLWTQISERDDYKRKYSIFMSVGKDGEWVSKAKKIYEMDYLMDARPVYLVGRTFVNDKSIISFDEQGNVVSEKNLEADNIRKNIINTSSGAAFFDWQSEIEPLASYPDKLSFKDNHSVLTGMKREYALRLHALLDETQNKLYYGIYQLKNGRVDITNIKQLDIRSGEMLYDVNGEDKVAAMSADKIISAGEKGIYAFSSEEKKLGLIDTDLDTVAEVELPMLVLPNDCLNCGYSSDFFSITETPSEIHIWNIYEFQRNLALQLVSITKVD